MKKHGISKSVKQQEAAIVRKAANEKGIGGFERDRCNAIG